MRQDSILFWVFTAIMSLVFLFSATMYLTQYDMVVGFYEHLGFPTWMIYPSAIAKLLAIVAIVTNLSTLLKEWAYAGLFFDAAMAIAAHSMAGDGLEGSVMAIVALIGVMGSRIFDGRLGR